MLTDLKVLVERPPGRHRGLAHLAALPVGEVGPVPHGGRLLGPVEPEERVGQRIELLGAQLLAGTGGEPPVDLAPPLLRSHAIHCPALRSARSAPEVPGISEKLADLLAVRVDVVADPLLRERVSSSTRAAPVAP
jgi:hypothetical protein